MKLNHSAFLFIIPLLFLSSFAAAVDLGQCLTLGTVGQTYTLNQSVSSANTCMNVTAANVTLDCNGFTINYSSGTIGYGIYSNSTNTTIKNCIINETSTTASAYGIYYLGASASNGTIYNNSVTTLGTSAYGIYLLTNANNNNVTNNNIATSGLTGYGINLNAANNTLVSSNILTTSAHGIWLSSASSSNTISGNNITTSYWNGARGIGISSGSNNTASSNNIVTTGYSSHGIVFSTSPNITISGNNIITNGNYSYGIWLSTNNSNGTISSNNVSTNGIFSYGIRLHGGTSLTGSNNNNVSNNTFVTINSSAYSVSLVNSTGNSFSNNLLNASGAPDVYVDGTGVNNFTNCSFNKTDTGFVGGATGGINVFWYANVHTVDSFGPDLGSVTINESDVNGISLFNGTTNSTGWLATQTIQEYMQNVTGIYNYTPHGFNATKGGYAYNDSNYSIDAGKTITIALTASIIPQYSNRAINITNNTQFDPNTAAQASITWVNETKIIFNWNGVNHTITAPYQYYLGVLGAGSYSNYWCANSSTNDWNCTPTQTFEVLQNTTNTCHLALNGSEGDISYNYGETTNATGWLLTTEGTGSLSLNGSSVSNPYIGNLGGGTWDFIFSKPATQNYTLCSAEHFAEVTPVSSSAVLQLNGTDGDVVMTYGQTSSVAAGCSGTSLELYRNSSLLGVNPDELNLGAGTYNYTVNCIGNENYTSSFLTHFLNVNKAAHSLHLALNSTEDNLTINYGETSNATAWMDETEGTINLDLNGTPVSNPDIRDFGGSSYWLYNASITETDNYTAGYVERFVTVNQISSLANLLLNGTNANLTINYGQTSNAAGSCTGVTGILYRNSSIVSSPEILDFGAGTYNYTLSCVGNDNYSTTYSTFFVNVNQADSSAFNHLYLNGSASDLVIVYLDTSNATAWTDLGQGTVTLYRNSVAVFNPEIANLSIGTYIYTSYYHSQNYTDSNTTFQLTVAPNSAIPVVTIITPTNYSTYSLVPITINGTCLDSIGIDSIWASDYRWSGTAHGSPFQLSNTSALSLGAYSVIVYCNNTLGHVNSSEVFFDITGSIPSPTPYVVITAPSNASSHVGALAINGTCADVYGIDSIWTNDYRWASVNHSSPFSFDNTSGLGLGSYNVVVYCNSTTNGTINSEQVYFNIIASVIPTPTPDPACSNYTNTCMAPQPKYCDQYGRLVDYCQSCGCLTGQTCTPYGTCSNHSNWYDFFLGGGFSIYYKLALILGILLLITVVIAALRTVHAD